MNRPTPIFLLTLLTIALATGIIWILLTSAQGFFQ
jgi:hypothetical protein